MRGENIKAVVFTKCLLMIISLYLSYIFMVSEGLSLMGISNIQMVCFEYIFPDLLSSTSQMTNKMSGLIHASAEGKQQCVVFFLIKLATMGVICNHRSRKIKIREGELDMQVTTMFSTLYSKVRQTV